MTIPPIPATTPATTPSNAPFYCPDIADIEAGETCQMKRWFQAEHEGNGIIKADALPETHMKFQLLQDLRLVSEMPEIDAATITKMLQASLDELPPEVRTNPKMMELVYRRLGMVAAYALYKEPVIRTLWETVLTPADVILERDPLWVILHPGRLLKCRRTGELLYREFLHIPAGFIHTQWLRGQAYNMRIHATMIALENDLGEKLAGKPIQESQVTGLGEGYRSGVSGRLMHPYVWAARNLTTGEWRRDIPLTGNEGWVGAPVWEFPDGIVQWVLKLGETVATSLFPISSPFKRDTMKVAQWAGSILRREREIGTNLAACQGNLHLRSTIFHRTTTACSPGVGSPCPFTDACWKPSLTHDPIKDGIYIKASSLTVLKATPAKEVVVTA